MSLYTRTDLAAELPFSEEEGFYTEKAERNGFPMTDVKISSPSAATKLGKPIGRYLTVDIGKIWLADDKTFEKAADLIGKLLAELSVSLLGHEPESLLVVGLGNRHLTADSLGDLTVGQLTVTRHLQTADPKLYSLLGGHSIAAVAPGVIGQTGIESSEVLRGLCREISPSLVIAVDSLCARSPDRLATTVQLGDSGISPGSGIGNARLALSRETLGVPVIALGIPTVVNSATLVEDALERAGIPEIPEELHTVLETGRSFFVMPKESDITVRELSRLLAEAIGNAFSFPTARA